MLIKVVNIGKDKSYSRNDILKEIHKCDECGRIYSFEYSTSTDIETMTAIAQHMAMKRRELRSPAAGDICYMCKELKQRGYCQLSLV